MSNFEALWYSSYSPAGDPPHCQRLCRQPLAAQWDFAIDLAIAFAEGHAGYRSIGRNSTTGETYWYFDGGPMGATLAKWLESHPRSKRVASGWWIIPYRIEERVFALNKAAVDCEIHRGRGRAEGAAIVDRLRKWMRSGHWRQIAARVFPRHTAADPPRVPKARQRTLARIESLCAAHPRYQNLTIVRREDCYECDNGHFWPEGDTCPVCGEHWE